MQQFDFTVEGITDFRSLYLVVSHRLLDALDQFEVLLQDALLGLTISVHGIADRIPDIAAEDTLRVSTVHGVNPMLDTTHDSSGTQQACLRFLPFGHGPSIASIAFLVSEFSDSCCKFSYDLCAFNKLAVYHHLLRPSRCVHQRHHGIAHADECLDGHVSIVDLLL